MDQESHESNRLVQHLSPVRKTTDENSSSSVNGAVLDSLTLSNSVQTSTISGETRDLGSSKVSVEAPETGDRRVIAENMSNLVHGVMLETVIVRNSEESASCSGEKGDIASKIDELGSSDAVVEAQDTSNRQRVSERMNQIDQVLETVVNLDQTASVSGENNELEAKINELYVKREECKAENESCVIDVKCGGGDEKGFKVNGNEERVCRICHLNSEQSSEAIVNSSTMDLIQLGCGCKDELGIAHTHCAEAWFKLRGNRLCEICGQTAKNITGVGDFRFMEEWNEHRFIGSSSSSSESGGCWRGQPFCNFLMACLVIAFVLPWFFRVNMF